MKLLDRLPKSGIVRSGQLFPLKISELRISDEDGLQLPTPTASHSGKVQIDKSKIDPKKGINQRFYTKKGKQTQRSLSRLADWKMLPTPTASDPDKHGTGSLIRLIEKGVRYSAGDHRNLPTPTAHLAKENGCASEYTRKTPTLICHFQKKDTGERQVLSPLFVEWMMGFPIGWTDLER